MPCATVKTANKQIVVKLDGKTLYLTRAQASVLMHDLQVALIDTKEPCKSSPPSTVHT